jgi:hypothetical protein
MVMSYPGCGEMSKRVEKTWVNFDLVH